MVAILRGVGHDDRIGRNHPTWVKRGRMPTAYTFIGGTLPSKESYRVHPNVTDQAISIFTLGGEGPIKGEVGRLVSSV